jgi:hypothetical protein
MTQCRYQEGLARGRFAKLRVSRSMLRLSTLWRRRVLGCGKTTESSELMSMRSFEQSRQFAVRNLKDVLHGAVVLPDDERYATARQVWNCAVDHHPVMIAFCETAEDVQAAVHTAREYDLQISVRGGGYDVEGRSVRSNGLAIDLSQMNHVEVNSRIAIVAGGSYCCCCHFRCRGKRPHRRDRLQRSHRHGWLNSRWLLRPAEERLVMVVPTRQRSKEHLIAFVPIAFISILSRRLKRLVVDERRA